MTYKTKTVPIVLVDEDTTSLVEMLCAKDCAKCKSRFKCYTSAMTMISYKNIRACGSYQMSLSKEIFGDYYHEHCFKIVRRSTHGEMEKWLHQRS